MRYLQALFITIIIFAISAFAILSLFNTKNIKQKEIIVKVIPITDKESGVKEVKKPSKVKKAFTKQTVIAKQKITPKVIKKISDKKIKTKAKKTIKKVIKTKFKKIKHKRISKKTIHKKSILKKTKTKKHKTSKYKPKKIKHKDIINQKSSYLVSTQKNNFLSKVRAKIKANLVYPEEARYNHIEGSVEVVFNILPNGRVDNIRFLKAKRVFRKSILNAFNKVFPINIPTSIQPQAPFRDIYLPLNFKIQN